MINHSKKFNDKKYNEIINLINNSDKTHVEIATLMNLIKTFTTFNKFIIQINNEPDIFNKFITICNINHELFNIFIKQIKLNKLKYKQDYCDE